MKKTFINILFFFIAFIFPLQLSAQSILLDDFEVENEWEIFASDGVDASFSYDKGFSGNAIKFNYDFKKGTGYGGIQKFYEISLTDNYQFTFYLKADSPNNNFEIKFLDHSGENVWWVNNRNFEFPTEWKKITIKKRHINFAWGPTNEKELKKIERIEFTIASYSGGKGSIFIDDLKFEILPASDTTYNSPIINTSTEINESYNSEKMLDNNSNSSWKSKNSNPQIIDINFQGHLELGGFIIEWDKINYAKNYKISLSNDLENWETVYSTRYNAGNRNYIRLTNTEAHYAKIIMENCNGEFFQIYDIKILNPEYSEDINRFFINISKDFPRGYFPRYFYEEKSYWNVIGVNSDSKEALISEDGLVEIDKSKFLIEPMINLNGNLITWNNPTKNQYLENEYLPLSNVDWKMDEVNLNIKAFASGEANINSVIYLNYSLKNISYNNISGNIYLLLRPFQVNPYYQNLNLIGGVANINSIDILDNKVIVNNSNAIYSSLPFNSAGALRFEEGNIVEYLSNGKIPQQKNIIDQFNLGSGVLAYNFNLKPQEEKIITLAIPFYPNPQQYNSLDISPQKMQLLLNETMDYWEKKLSHIKFNLPTSADKIVNTYKSNLAYILINRDNAGIQPGSRSYERSWIRDGSLTSAALLKSGIVDEVREFIDWYSNYQYENGKIPCVVDHRGPDPVPEHDSHGEYIFLIKQFFNFTKDTSVLRNYNNRILKTVEYISSLISQRSTDYFKFGNDSIRAYYGIMPESISHEGYSAKPMHSYWDNFFTVRGLKDVTDIQKILGKKDSFDRISKIRDKFSDDLYNSLNLAMKTKKINYIPGSVELGDFDATSTTIAIYPCNELPNLPKIELENTFNKYYDFFSKRKNGEIEWTAYTPYEVRIIGSFIFLNRPEIAHELIEFFLNDQRPNAWNHWAEVVWNDYRYPGFIGDMPHTWVGSDFINAIRTLFVYENDYDSSLVIGAGLYQNWIDSPNGISIENLPTYYGDISYSIKKEKEKYFFSIYGDITPPMNGIKIKNFNSSKLPFSVSVNGKQVNSFTSDEIIINEFPSKIEINYLK